MKFLHLGDLHIGKKVNGFNLIEDQKFVLNQAIQIVKEKSIEAVLISGDVFDRSVPSSSALEIFDNFLKEISSIDVKIFAISGNHDNIDRFSYLSNFLKSSGIYFSSSFDGNIEYYDIDNNYRVYLMPHLYPALIRSFYPEAKINNYNDAIKVLLDGIDLDDKKINIILAHQFVSGSDDLIFSDSEQKSVGTLDIIDYSLFKNFDYVALGHLHCPQKISLEKIRYSGSILKYSFSELKQKKYFTVLELSKNNLQFEFIDIIPIHEMKEYRGFIDEFLSPEFYSKIDKNDYIHFILLDEYVLDAKKKLSLIYPNIMLLEFDNSFTKSLNANFNFSYSKNLSIEEHFENFYETQFEIKTQQPFPLLIFYSRFFPPFLSSFWTWA